MLVFTARFIDFSVPELEYVYTKDYQQVRSLVDAVGTEEDDFGALFSQLAR